MVGAVAVDMIDGFIKGGYRFNGKDGVQIFGMPVFICSRFAGNDCPDCFISFEQNAL